MICVSCGKTIPDGTRFCIHCGVEQAVPTPIAAVAAATSIAHASSAKAANAAHAEPRKRELVRAANQASADDPSQSPAYAAQPPRRAIAVALVVTCVVIGAAVAAVIAWRSAGNGADRESASVAGGDGTVTIAKSATPRDTMTTIPSNEEPSPAPAVSEATSTPEVGAAAATGTAATPAGDRPVEIRPLPPRPAPMRVPRRAPVEESPPAQPSPQPPAPIHQAQVVPPNRAATPVAGGVVDHWRRMDDELSQCTRADFISRVVCGQRVRFRYCQGYWGKVAQCPASPAPERGQ
jgi:hypothetical protein